MSAPTKGMVAGKPIQTGELTKEFEEGHARIFGDVKPQRGRFVYRPELGRCVEVGEDWTDAERRAQTPTEELVYGGLQHTDGTPLNSRGKHRQFLKDTGSAMARDYSDTFREKVKADRERSSDRELDRVTTEAITQAHNYDRRRR